MCVSSPILLFHNPAVFLRFLFFLFKASPQALVQIQDPNLQTAALSHTGSKQASHSTCSEPGLGTYISIHPPSLALECPARYQVSILTRSPLHTDICRVTSSFVLFIPRVKSSGSELWVTESVPLDCSSAVLLGRNMGPASLLKSLRPAFLV